MTILMLVVVLTHAFLACHQRRNLPMQPLIQQEQERMSPTTTTNAKQFYSTSGEQEQEQETSVGVVLKDLEIMDTKQGTGDVVAKFDSIVTIQYTGKILESGDEFDVNNMITFKLGYGKVLEGCEQGIRGMKVGGIRRLKIPSRLGFGPQTGMDGTVPPNTDLEYQVELVSVTSGPMAEAAANMGIGLHPNTVYLK